MTKLRPITPISILAEELNLLLSEIDHQELGTSTLRDKLVKCHDLAVGMDPYLEKHTTPESEELASLKEETLTADWGDKDDPKLVKGLEAEMLSGHVEGQFLKTLIAISGAKNILEIGVFSGYSALAMAQALPDDGRIVACERDRRAVDFARNQFNKAGLGNKIELRLGSGADTLCDLARSEAHFDMMFIDADKPNYRHYVEFSLENNLINIGGLFVVDNTLLQGEPYLASCAKSIPGEAIATFNQYLSSEDRVEQVILPLRDGVTLARRVK